MKPTAEQIAVADLFRQGDTMVVDALAGTGKTTTLRLLAASTRRRGVYVAYNRAIVDDVATSLPWRCSARTAHSLAMSAVGHRYRHRLGQPRLRSYEVAQRLGIRPIVVHHGLPNPKRLAPGWLAGHVMQGLAAFANSADPEPTAAHFPYREGIDLPDVTGRRSTVNNRIVAEELEGALRKAWQDITHPDGSLRFTHDHYLKIWALGHPTIEADYVLLDEAQDTNPVLADVLARQSAQVVYVGDENQQLYAWRGAVDAMATFAPEHRRSLTQTFRFGLALADVANEVLDALDASLRIVGNPERTTTVGPLAGRAPDAILCRTNAEALHVVLGAQTRGQPVHLVGNGTEAAAFAKAVADLRTTGFTAHPDLACFDTWGDVQDYVAHDPGGSELRLMVSLVEKFGTEGILRAVSGTIPEGPGVLTVSTAHRAKGRQWPVVRLGGDFADLDPTTPELRLQYVAVTRAIEHLDRTALETPAERDARRTGAAEVPTVEDTVR